MRPLVMRLLSIRAPSYAAIACIPCVSRGSGLPVFFLLSPANVHDAPFAQPLLQWAVRLYAIRPRIVRLDAAYWGLRLIAWIHTTLHAVAVVPWNPKRQRNRSCLPPTWTKEELGKLNFVALCSRTDKFNVP